MNSHYKPRLEQLEQRPMMSANPLALAASSALTYYTVDGTGNNLAHPTWGSAGADLLRSILPSAYADGVSSPNGQNLPSARAISNAVGAQSGDLLDANDITAFTYAWGQFIDHDLDLTPDGGTSLPIAVPKGDPTFDPNSTGTQTLPFTRSITDPATGTSTSNPLNQSTVVTSFLDGSMIYGSDPTRAAALRTFRGGQLKTSAGNLMPFNTAGLPNSNESPYPDNQMFLGGDIRANENIELTSLQTLFLREHNYWAGKIAAQNPSFTDEKIFQQARSIVIAEIQSITFNEFLPAILGAGAITPYTGYKSNVNPGITPEFSEAAYRFGHSQLDDDVQFFTNNGSNLSFTYQLPGGISMPVNTKADQASGHTGMSLVDAFFDPYVMQAAGVEGGILKYLASDVAQAVDLKMVDAVRNVLFGAPGSGAGGQDLFALDIQRGRDVGLPTYNQARVAYGLPAVTSFSQISSDPAVQQQLQALYGNVDKVELFVGGLAEDHARGSSMGATFQAIIANQFERVRDGDRLWYQNQFSGAALSALQHTTLADIISRNTGISNLQSNVFVFHAGISGNVFTDSHANGRLDRGERPLSGVTVELLNAASGQLEGTTTTDARGNYSFDVTSAGALRVQVVQPGGQLSSVLPSRNVAITRGDQFQTQVNFAMSRGRGIGFTPSAVNWANLLHQIEQMLAGAWAALGTGGATANSAANSSTAKATSNPVANNGVSALPTAAPAQSRIDPQTALAAVDSIFNSPDGVDWSLRD